MIQTLSGTVTVDDFAVIENKQLFPIKWNSGSGTQWIPGSSSKQTSSTLSTASTVASSIGVSALYVAVDIYTNSFEGNHELLLHLISSASKLFQMTPTNDK